MNLSERLKECVGLCDDLRRDLEGTDFSRAGSALEVLENADETILSDLQHHVRTMLGHFTRVSEKDRRRSRSGEQ